MNSDQHLNDRPVTAPAMEQVSAAKAAKIETVFRMFRGHTYPTGNMAALRAMLEAYSEKTLEQFICCAEEDPELIPNISLPMMEHVTERHLMELLCFKDRINYPHYGLVIRLLESLHLYVQLPQCDDYSLADELTQRQCIALLNGVLEIWNRVPDIQKTVPGVLTETRLLTGRSTLMISDEPLVSLLMERVDDVESIVHIMGERQTADVNVLTAVLDAEVYSLSNGIL